MYCMFRNFGLGDTSLQIDKKMISNQKTEFTLSVGKHSCTVSMFKLWARFLQFSKMLGQDFIMSYKLSPINFGSRTISSLQIDL